MAVYAVTDRGEERLHPSLGATVADVLRNAGATAGSLQGSAVWQTPPDGLWLQTYDGGALRFANVHEFRVHEDEP